MDFFIIAVPALLVMVVMKYRYSHQISTKEFLYHFLAVCLSIAVMMGITYASLYTSMLDTEVLNGKVLSKSRDVEYCTEYSSCKHYTVRKSCTYSYDSKGNAKESCISYKDFDYLYEVDWHVKTSVDTHEIERVNRQGTKKPPRWDIIQIGEPASTESTYINYLLGNEDSLFYEQQYDKDFTKEYKKTIPNYPSIYDYYRINHVINLTNVDDTGYNSYINNELREMGSVKQVNIVLVMYPEKDIDFVKAVTSKWRGGKKNDVIMFAGLSNEGIVNKFSSTSFAKGMQNEFLHSTLRMTALTEPMSLELVHKLVNDINVNYKRLPNKEFEYMKYKLEPSMWIVILSSILAAVASYFVGIYMRNNHL